MMCHLVLSLSLSLSLCVRCDINEGKKNQLGTCMTRRRNQALTYDDGECYVNILDIGLKKKQVWRLKGIGPMEPAVAEVAWI